MKERKQPVLHAEIANSVFGDHVLRLIGDFDGMSLAVAVRQVGFETGDRVTIALSPDHSKLRRRRGAR